MEGVGSRQGRASSRYGSGPVAPVFNGPVRKWKKQWVSSQSYNKGKKRNDTPPLLLCRWTPLTETDTTADEPRKRRFRYTPIVPIEKGNTKPLENVGNEARAINNNQLKGSDIITSPIDQKPNAGEISEEETQEEELNEDEVKSTKSISNDLYSEGNRNIDVNGGRRMVISWEE
ncbi:hypothetical protein ACJIZ3_013056 [Penstemon smallii]|uniref:Uncharacterized protein n=1 Tax=Penstemon smallii TaxID=265156 RepID=A0ABD3UNW2_9LAMI